MLSLIKEVSRCILTPNAMEFTRLVGYYVTNASQKYIEKHALLFNELQSTNILQQVRAMSILLGGVTILRKGEADVVSNGDDVYVLEDKGSPRRCGGQGDILAGSIAVAFNWAVRKVCFPCIAK